MSKEYSSKEKAIYQAVMELFDEGADLNSLTVSEITGRAGIGKGTAYEYFSDKEEMIAKSLLYNIEKYCKWVYDGISGEKNFYDKMKFLMFKVEQQLVKANCLFKLPHMMSDHSMIGRRILELKEKRTSDEMLPMDMLKQVLLDEFSEEKVFSEETITYLAMNIFSKILCYGMLLNEGRCQKEEERKKMRELICRGICREIEEM